MRLREACVHTSTFHSYSQYLGVIAKYVREKAAVGTSYTRGISGGFVLQILRVLAVILRFSRTTTSDTTAYTFGLALIRGPLLPCLSGILPAVLQVSRGSVPRVLRVLV